jgi:hypothetical protein
MDRFIAPNGAGTKDGASRDNAAPVTGIDAQIKLAGPGGRVLLRSDMGPYKGTYVGIASGGVDGKPVTIKGCDDRVVECIGTRANPYSPTGDRGKPFFQVKESASNLNLVGMNAKNIGDGLFYFTGQHRNIRMSGLSAWNVRQLIKVKKNDAGPNATLDNFAIETIRVTGHSKAAIELWNSTNGHIIDVIADSAKQDGDPYCFGLFADGDSHDVDVSKMVVRNIQYTDLPEKYWNGDGVSLEGTTKRFTFNDCHMFGIEDGAFDLKGVEHVVRNCSADRVKRGVRVWQDVSIDGFQSTNLTKRGGIGGRATVWVAAGAKVTVKNMTDDPNFVRFDTTDGHCTVIDLDTHA